MRHVYAFYCSSFMISISFSFDSNFPWPLFKISRSYFPFCVSSSLWLVKDMLML